MHPWDVSFREAVQIQQRLAQRVSLRTPARLSKRLRDPNLLIGAADVSYNRGSSLLFGAVVVMRLGDFELIDQVTGHRRTQFPYVSGFLSFREAPVLVEAFQQLKTPPDLLLCDGQGLAHPRRFGLACHLGVLLGLPTIGCAKSRLIGVHREPGRNKGSKTALYAREEQIGYVLRTRTAVKPLYISVGHQIDLDDASQLVLQCCPRYRIPEPIRQAHLMVNAVRVAASQR